MKQWLHENAWAHIDFTAPWKERWKTAVGVSTATGLLFLFTAWRAHPTLGWSDALFARAWIWAIGLTLGLAIALPGTGRYAYCGFMGFAGLIGAGISLLALAFAFYGVFTPVSLALRLRSADLLQRRAFKRAAAAQSAWNAHRGRSPRERYTRMS